MSCILAPPASRNSACINALAAAFGFSCSSASSGGAYYNPSIQTSTAASRSGHCYHSSHASSAASFCSASSSTAYEPYYRFCPCLLPSALPSPPPSPPSLPPYIFAVDHLRVVSGPCVVSGQCVHSHNYPGSYANREHCTLQPVDGQPLRVKAFNTEEGFDFLTINGVRYSGSGGTDEHGNSIPEDIVPDREITWSSDGSAVRSS